MPCTNEPFGKFECDDGGRCSGCDWIELDYTDQKLKKIQDLFAKVNAASPNSLSDVDEIEWLAVAPGGFRSRSDFTIASAGAGWVSGFYDLSYERLLDIESCPQMSPPLMLAYKIFRKNPIPVAKGSARIRVSPSGKMGLWLDFANLDIKELLIERSVLEGLLENFVVEIGQRRKRLVSSNGILKLSDPVLENWFDTYDDQGNALPLYCTVGSFTQVGLSANKVLVQKVLQIAKKSAGESILEYGCGIGNFTVPFAMLRKKVQVLEIDGLALRGLELALHGQKCADQVRILGSGKKSLAATVQSLHDADLLVVDPPRSGLGDFLKILSEIEKGGSPGGKRKSPVAQMIYISCFPDSFAKDFVQLRALGYRLQNVSIVDQFPQTHHYEIVAHLQYDSRAVQ